MRWTPPVTRQVRERTAPVTRYSRGLHDKGRSPFGAPRRIDGSCLPPRPGPARLGITGCKREVCTPSPAPLQRAPRSPDTCRTGMMPRPPARRADEAYPQKPHPLHHSASPVDVPHDERAGLYVVLSGTNVNNKETLIHICLDALLRLRSVSPGHILAQWSEAYE